MKKLEKLDLFELKSYRELLENRLDQLQRYQVDGEYQPPHTDKEVKDLKELEKKAQEALAVINKLIRKKLDKFIKDL